VRRNLDRLFPRDLYGRIALALASLTLGPLFGFFSVAMLFRPKIQRPALEEWFIVSLEAFCLALAVFFACGFVWAVATPRRLERILEHVVAHLGITMCLFWIPFAIAAMWAMWSF